MKEIPTATAVYADEMMLYVLCKTAPEDILPYLRDIDTGDWAITQVEDNTSASDRIRATAREVPWCD